MNTVTSPGNYSLARGEIQLILGPMFSGKTSELLRRIRRYNVAKRRVLVIKWSDDTRYTNENKASSHDKLTYDAIPTKVLNDVGVAKDYDVIGIDEGQFYPDLLNFCESMANNGKIVVVAALDGTFQRKSFGQVLDLVPLSESVIKLHAVCMICQKSAAFTTRLSSETQEKLIGGTDTYIATCRTCFHSKHVSKQVFSSGRHLFDEQITPTSTNTTIINMKRQKLEEVPQDLVRQLITE